MKTKSKLGGYVIRSAAGVIFFLFVVAALNAANPSPFATVPEPIGVVASKSDLLVSEYCSQNLDTIDCFGNVSVLATILGPVGPCAEKYIAIAPLQSALAASPWSSGNVFITQGTAVYKVSGATAAQFATITGCDADHTGTVGWRHSRYE